MGNDLNPYQAYTDGSIFSDSPLNLVVALYKGAIDATREAENALRARDILGRSKAINKAISILTELLVSLDHEKGGEISKNLERLYSYMQRQLLAAHARQILTKDHDLALSAASGTALVPLDELAEEALSLLRSLEKGQRRVVTDASSR